MDNSKNPLIRDNVRCGRPPSGCEAIEPATIRCLGDFDSALKTIVESAARQGVPHGPMMARALRRIAQALAAEHGAGHAAGVLRFAARAIEQDAPVQRSPETL